jgi:hypothetical protein
VLATSPSGSAFAGIALSASLGLTALLSGAGAAWQAEPTAGAFLLATVAVVLASVACAERRRLPAAPVRIRTTAWAAAGALGTAALLEHGIDALTVAGGELPLSAGGLGGLYLGEVSVVVLVGALALGSALFGRRWQTTAGLLTMLLVLSPLAASPRLPRVAAAGDWVDAALLLGCLGWVSLLPEAPRSLRAELGRHGATAVGWLVPAVALTGVGSKAMEGESLIAYAGAQAFGPYGREVAAAFELGAVAVAAAGVLVLASRPLRYGPVYLVVAAAFAVAWFPDEVVLVAAGVAGWVAALLGPVPDEEVGAAVPALFRSP